MTWGGCSWCLKYLGLKPSFVKNVLNSEQWISRWWNHLQSEKHRKYSRTREDIFAPSVPVLAKMLEIHSQQCHYLTSEHIISTLWAGGRWGATAHTGQTTGLKRLSKLFTGFRLRTHQVHVGKTILDINNGHIWICLIYRIIKELLAKVETCPGFVITFDETLKQTTKSKQMDLDVWYHVQSR